MVVIEEIVHQHAEEAAILWGRRTVATEAPHLGLRDLAELDARLDAHLDGLNLGGARSWSVLGQELARGEAGEVFAAGVLAIAGHRQSHLDHVLECCTDIESADAMVGAFGWHSWTTVSHHLKDAFHSHDSMRRAVGLGAAAIHRVHPGQPLTDGVTRADPILRRRALKAAGELGATTLLPQCRANFDSPDRESRFWSAWSARLLGEKGATDVLEEIARAGGPRAERACDLAARSCHPTGLRLVRALAGADHTRRCAVQAAGALGDSVSIPWLIDLMAVDVLARPAGEAFNTITGLDIAAAGAERDWPAGFAAGPSEDPNDEDVAMDPDEHLPWPDRAAIVDWWSRHGAAFPPGQRYLLGLPIDARHLHHVLEYGRQRHRAAAALELALRRPNEPLFEVRMRADRQRRALGL